MDLNSLSGYTKVDRQKQSLITEMLYDEVDARAKRDFFHEDAKFDLAEDYCLSAPEPLPLKVCPECGSRNLTKIDRMNGYLSYSRTHGDTRLNDAKMIEISERRSM